MNTTNQPNSTSAQAKRFIPRTQVAGMFRRGGPQAHIFYRQMYGNGARTEEYDIHEEFVHSCERGDYNTVDRILKENPKFNIDVTDQLGRTAMRLAIENEHLEVVILLLQNCDGQKMREALLLAIYLGHVQIAEACLRHPKFKIFNDRKVFSNNTDGFWQTPSSDDAQFAPDITPLILASQCNRTEIVQLLLSGGDRITKPHDYHCTCKECQNRFKFDSLRHAQSRLNAYRGLASESYISLASLDPILTAFELGHELRDLSSKEKYFKNEYLHLADKLSAYAVKLLDKVRGHKELDCVLNKAGKENEDKCVVLARLYLAIKYEEKPFVAHSNCQQKLVEIWQSDIRNIFKLNPLIKFLLVLGYIFVLPLFCIFYILTSCSPLTIKFQKFLQQPCIKFLGHTISYAFFIILIILSSLLFAAEFKRQAKSLQDFYPNVSTILNKSIELCQKNDSDNCILYPHDNFYLRQDQPTWIDVAITVFVVGFLWREIKQGYTDGVRDYLLSWNNIIDLCMNILYLSSFGLKYYVFFKVKFAIQTLGDKNFQNDLETFNSLNDAAKHDVNYVLYWLNADRFYWVSLDPVNVAEGLFAIANIFSFSRICFLLPAIQHLGPLQISLGRMMSDIGKFIIIFLIIFCGFMFGLNNLFWYYSQSVRRRVEIVEHDPEEGDAQLLAEKYFGTMGDTFKTVFWSLFGLSVKEGVKLGNYENRFTETIGYLIYGTFNIASVIVLLNMLIAMMSKSYETIEEHADVEWKFARSKLYMEYIKEGGTLPAPFNLIPTSKSICSLFRKMFKCKKKSLTETIETNASGSNKTPGLHRGLRLPPTIVISGTQNNINSLPVPPNGHQLHLRNNSPRRHSIDNSQTLTYRKVIDRVIKRFLLHKQREEQDEIREGDFEELKQDIQMLRFEIINRLDEMRDDVSKSSRQLTDDVLVVGNLLAKLASETNPSMKENFLLFQKNFYSTINKPRSADSGLESNDPSTFSTASMPNLVNNVNSGSTLITSNSEPVLSLNNKNESDISVVQTTKHTSAPQITLSNIAEEDEDIDKYDGIEEEVEAHHISIQTELQNDENDQNDKNNDAVFTLHI